MTSQRKLLLRLALATLVVLGLLVALAPPRPAARISLPAALALGVLSGLLLHLSVARRRPSLPRDVGELPAVVACLSILAVAAADEEILWRRILLGELLGAGSIAAVLGSALGFALAHRRSGLHLLTGTVFGGVYVATGALATCVAAHLTYNLLLLWLGERASGLRSAPP